MMKRWRRSRLLLPACLALIVSHVSAAGADTPDYRRFNMAAVEHHVIPGYAKLAAETRALDEQVAVSCTAEGPDAAALADMRRAFHAAFDAWADVQHIGFGPVAQFMRAFRFEFWPDKRNVTEKQLRNLFAVRDEAALERERFRSSSVAVQGFSAMERLLFDGSFLADYAQDGPYFCRLLGAMSNNMRLMAAETLAAWREGEAPYADVMAVDEAGNEAYFDASEATVDLLMSAIGTLEFVADRKLALPLGSSLDGAKPRRAESWRSQRSLRNIRHNLAAVEALYGGAQGIGEMLRAAGTDETLDGEIQALLHRIHVLLAAIPDPLSEAVGDSALRPALEEAAAALRELRGLMTVRLAPALGILIGFNSLDGD